MTIAGKYRLVEVLAEGGFGTVYKAQHIALKQAPERVIKFIRPEVFAMEGIERRFHREVQITAALSQQNTHIVRVLDDFGEIPHLGHYYVMEYLEGQSLGRWLSERAELPSLAECRHIFVQLCSAMRSAHRANVVHRDLKPDNLMLIEQDGDPLFLKVLDFGIARPLHTSGKDKKLTRGAMGTPLYMSPEQCLNKDVDARSDIYSMGLLLFELLVGHSPFVSGRENHEERPFEELLAAQIHKTPPMLSIVAPPQRDIPVALEAVVARALQKSPRDRYPSVDQLEQDFLRALSPDHRAVSAEFRVASSAVSSSQAALPSHLPTLPPDTQVTPVAQDAEHVWEEKPPASPPPMPTTAPQVTTLQGGEEGRGGEYTGENTARLLASMERDRRKRLGLTLAVFLLGLGVVWFVLYMQTPAPTTRSEGYPANRKPRQKRPGKPIATTRTLPIPPVRRTSKLPQPQHRPGVIVPLKPQPRPAKRKRHRSKPRRIVRKTRIRRPRPKVRVRVWIRYVQGCPRRPMFWSRIRLPASQRHRVRPRISRGRIVPRSDGFCIGTRYRNTRLQFGHSAEGFVPCILSPAALPPNARIVLQEEGLMEPGSTSYCLR